MSHDPAELDDLGVLRIRGPDALRFLQGQLSNDVERLPREGSLLAGLHNPQGRTIALLRLVRLAEAVAEHDVLALLPRELVEPVAARLRRFVLRAKVRITDESAAWRVQGFVQGEAPDGIAVRVSGTPVRWLRLAPLPGAAAGDPATAGVPVASNAQPADAAAAKRAAPSCDARRAWRLLDIAAGLPQVYARTSEQFVAQMLNLDAIDAISFSKGCYTGQEVIARAHYRGRVKRRMQRWRTALPASLAPGDAAQLADGRALRVVEAATLPDGRCELLAVAPLTGAAESETGDAGGPTSAAAGPAAAAARAAIDAEPLPLPYELPS